jgi:biofilm PGA synthesis N-glycosyltransferase PgaC
MATFIVVFILVFGVNTSVWGLTGLGRALIHAQGAKRGTTAPSLVRPAHVAVLIAAHNEELVIANTITSARALVPVVNIFVASDASTDGTAAVARAAGANVLEITPNRGKAGALVAALNHFKIAGNFSAVMLLDADTHLSADYMATALPYFNDPAVVAIAGRVSTIAEPQSSTLMGRFLVAYRERFYVAVQYLLKYGQAARGANVVSIVPGFASLYRSSVLQYIEIDAPGLAIEDFNMTFEVHAKKLGKIAFHPHAAIAYTQDPDNFHDYSHQLGRWALGFWQTLARHKFRVGKFWAALAFFLVELISSSIMMVILLPVLLLSSLATIATQAIPQLGGPALWLAEFVPPQALIAGVLIPDYLLTVVVAIVVRRPKYLLLGVAFPLMRIVDAAICLRALPRALFGTSTGAWKSPTRRANDQKLSKAASLQP